MTSARTIFTCSLFVAVSLASGRPAPAQTRASGDLSYADLLEQMVDLRWLATAPLDGERGYQFSSYDRKSNAATRLTRQENPDAWYANADCGQYLREENYQGKIHWVMADCSGPAAVVRIWSANPQGRLLFFIDGELSFSSDFKELCSGRKTPFIAPICGEHSRGWNCYLPIPFQEHLKILATNNGFYYHVNIRQFPAQTRVESFSPALADKNRSAIEQTAAILAKPTDLYPPATFAPLPLRADVAAGQTVELVRFEGAGLLRRLALRPVGRNLRYALRATRLVIHVDGATQAVVDCPLGDFFGTAPDFTPYAGYPLGVTPDGTGYCHYPMPASKGMVVALVNDGEVALSVSGETVWEAGGVEAWPLRLHAGWRTARDLPTRPRSDYLMLETGGPGRFVGCALMLRNPVRSWWGEGDEHIFVDGETFPSSFGTGSEDYFGYAWGSPEPFQHAYHNQPRCDGPGTYGYTSLNRFHLVDQVPFQRSFRFDLEVWHWADCKIDMASVAYWYGASSGKASFEPAALAERLAPIIEPIVIKRVAGALEGESMQVLNKTAGKVTAQKLTGFGQDWSNENQLWWTEAKVGDVLELAVEVPEAGLYDLRAQFTKAVDYGQVRISVGDTVLDERLDLYHDGVAASGELSLGEVRLERAGNSLRIEIVGANDKAVKAYMFGLDYVLLKRLDGGR